MRRLMRVSGSGAGEFVDHVAVHGGQGHAAGEGLAQKRRVLALGAQGFGGDDPGFVGVEEAEIGRIAGGEAAVGELEDFGRPPGEAQGDVFGFEGT